MAEATVPGHLASLERALDFFAEAASEISGPDGVDSNSAEFWRAQARPNRRAQARPESQRQRQNRRQTQRQRQEAEAEVEAEAEAEAVAEAEADAEAEA